MRALIFAALLGAAAAIWTWTAPGDPALFPGQAPDGVEIHVLDNGFHTDIAVPRAALEAGTGPLAQASRALGPGAWVRIGWGDARFYVDQSPIGDRLPDGARAFFRPGNASVIMLDPEPRDPRLLPAEDGRRTLVLTPQGFKRLRDRVEGSLALRDGHAVIAAVRPGDDSRFFASTEHFSILHLCNHWVAGVLNAAGLPVRPARAIVSSEVIASVDRAT